MLLWLAGRKPIFEESASQPWEPSLSSMSDLHVVYVAHIGLVLFA